MQESAEQAPLASGVYAALATPRRPGSIEVDTAALLDYADAITAAGVDGIVLFGSTGEFVHLSSEERTRSAALAIKRSHVPVLVNVSHSTLYGAWQLAEAAIDAGAAGILLMPPYFYTYGDAQICEFYRQFANSLRSAIPIYLYNLPVCTNPLSPELLKRLLETGHFAGIKDSSGDRASLEWLIELRQTRPFRLLVGHERLLLKAYRNRADGTISGVAGAVPELVVALTKAARSGDFERAERLDGRLSEFLNYVERFPATVIIRQAALLRGWKLKESAVPLDDDLAAEVISFHTWFRQWLPEVLHESLPPASTTVPAVKVADSA